MIREKALELMEKGIKVSHRNFTREEYLYLRDGYYFADRFFNDPMFVDGSHRNDTSTTAIDSST